MKCLLNPPKCNCNLWQEAKSLVSWSLSLLHALWAESKSPRAWWADLSLSRARGLWPERLAHKALARLAASLPRCSTLSRSASWNNIEPLKSLPNETKVVLKRTMYASEILRMPPSPRWGLPPPNQIMKHVQYTGHTTVEKTKMQRRPIDQFGAC